MYPICQVSGAMTLYTVRNYEKDVISFSYSINPFLTFWRQEEKTPIEEMYRQEMLIWMIILTENNDMIEHKKMQLLSLFSLSL